MPTPDHTASADQFHTMCIEVFDYYMGAIETDMNNYVKEHRRSMDVTFAHNDVTRLLVREETLTPGILAGIMAAVILREIGRKGKGRG